jgi:hypothetical protein
MILAAYELSFQFHAWAGDVLCSCRRNFYGPVCACRSCNGEPLDGSKRNYTLTFAAGEFPPVNAFWSVTMYDGKSQLLIKNPINRYLINSPMLPGMKKNEDGSLTLYIQKDKAPGIVAAN